ncbi:hypothetical protein [Lysinibacillus sp. SGAir0095]|uniref:hypothetical protein n=1 Tax=Lysinibacillus sp. SGAir0095 TaxID=2070463 RepID=UPI0010CCD005|nr:hypothetical protein [Lysinibacillus sp. SGAir0095]QCR33903.1 hypothetical protein C1N55_17970 [Lysinibacillus sp. SGAir0095]
MKKISLAIIFLVLLLIACPSNNNDLIFTGESELWSAVVVVNQSIGVEKYHMQLNYKGTNIEKIDFFHYQVASLNNTNIEFGVSNATLNDEGVYLKKLLASNSPTSKAEDELVVKIKYNNNSDSFTLSTK